MTERIGGARRFVPWLGAGSVLGAAVVLADFLAPDPGRAAAFRWGAGAGTFAGALSAYGVGRWLAASLAEGGSAFLAPLAGGFLVKLCVLGAGAWLLAAHPDWGLSYVAYALAFAGAAVAWHLLFLVSELRMRGGPPDR